MIRFEIITDHNRPIPKSSHANLRSPSCYGSWGRHAENWLACFIYVNRSLEVGLEKHIGPWYSSWKKSQRISYRGATDTAAKLPIALLVLHEGLLPPCRFYCRQAWCRYPVQQSRGETAASISHCWTSCDSSRRTLSGSREPSCNVQL